VRWRTRLASVVVAVCAVLFGVLGWVVASGQATQSDLLVTQGVQELHHPLLVAAMVLVSAFGLPPLNVLVVLAAVLVFWRAGYWVESRSAALAAVGIAAVGSIAKQIWLRSRPAPDAVRVIGSSRGYSFPSGHTLFYVGFFGYLLYWSYATLRPGRLRTVLLWAFGVLIVLIGPSRIFLGHHWASDVLAAYALGLGYLVLLIRLYASVRLSTTARGLARSLA
jgi:undecaprenyl-diphosphatase